MSNGIPFLCWPYFAHQFLNESYICEDWKVGLRFKKDENGIIRHEEIKNKIEQILEDKGYKERALNLQNKTMDSVRGGCSYKNFINFIEWIKDEKKNPPLKLGESSRKLKKQKQAFEVMEILVVMKFMKNLPLNRNLEVAQACAKAFHYRVKDHPEQAHYAPVSCANTSGNLSAKSIQMSTILPMNRSAQSTTSPE
ncbi:Uncharacterized protein Fot_05831 [Forsythia ovata]|uniref:Uncharacterized protein n=1 Tax=Forsythia ovata TaxID=205694 RepID=A0ABD1WRM3_9LAMI